MMEVRKEGMKTGQRQGDGTAEPEQGEGDTLVALGGPEPDGGKGRVRETSARLAEQGRAEATHSPLTGHPPKKKNPKQKFLAGGAFADSSSAA